MRNWKVGLLVVLALASVGRVRRDITGRTMQQVRNASIARSASRSLEARVKALEARVSALEGKRVAKAQPRAAQPKAQVTVYLTYSASKRRIGAQFHRLTCRRLGRNPSVGSGRDQVVARQSGEAQRRGAAPCRMCRPLR